MSAVFATAKRLCATDQSIMVTPFPDAFLRLFVRRVRVRPELYRLASCVSKVLRRQTVFDQPTKAHYVVTYDNANDSAVLVGLPFWYRLSLRRSVPGRSWLGPRLHPVQFQVFDIVEAARRHGWFAGVCLVAFAFAARLTWLGLWRYTIFRAASTRESSPDRREQFPRFLEHGPGQLQRPARALVAAVGRGRAAGLGVESKRLIVAQSVRSRRPFPLYALARRRAAPALAFAVTAVAMLYSVLWRRRSSISTSRSRRCSRRRWSGRSMRAAGARASSRRSCWRA